MSLYEFPVEVRWAYVPRDFAEAVIAEYKAMQGCLS